MIFKNALASLRENSEVIRLLVDGVSEEAAHRKPNANSWSIVEVINHLYDEERGDFCKHLDQVLHRPNESWSRIDPQAWVMERDYNGRPLPQSLANFLEERQRSLDWLQSLTEPDWETTHQTPWGQISAGELMAAWAAHDLLHIRQLIELKWGILKSDMEPYQVAYAGDW